MAERPGLGCGAITPKVVCTAAMSVPCRSLVRGVAARASLRKNASPAFPGTGVAYRGAGSPGAGPRTPFGASPAGSSVELRGAAGTFFFAIEVRHVDEVRIGAGILQEQTISCLRRDEAKSARAHRQGTVREHELCGG